MGTPVRYGLLLGVLVVIWTLVLGYTGWYKDPTLMNAFWLVIPVQAVVLYLALRKTAAEGRTYGGQIVAGLVLSLVASVVIFIGSYVFTEFLFPNYFEELRVSGERVLTEQGRTPEEIQEMQAQMAPMQNSVANAMAGVIGTVLTGLVLSLIFGIFLRRKSARVPT